MAHSEPAPTVDYAPPQRALWPRPAVIALKFTLAMVACTATCTAVWQSCVTDVLYHCSDSLWLDYLQGPGGWVHGDAAGQPGNFGDTIRPGWSLRGLEALWFSMLAASVIASLVLSRIRWSGTPHNGPA
jgi:hypothetical protein